MSLTNNNKQNLPIPINIVVTTKDSCPALELRKTICDIDLIKLIISCAYHDRPVILQPSFNNKINAISALIEKGIVYREGDEFFFTI
jgi:hypothetical protein